MQLHYQTQGQGQPLILLHGLFGSSDNWGVVAKHFSQSYQVISVDLRNHGKSPHFTTQTYPEMADDIVKLCDTLGLAQIHLLGHSLGGKVAMQFATQYPQYMRKLIVVDMAMRAYADAHTHLIDSMLALDFNQLLTRAEADKALSQSIPNIMVRQFLLMNLIKHVGQLKWRINLPALKANYPAMLNAVCADAMYQLPSLFIRGERSDYVQASDIAELSRHFVNAQFVSLPTEHWVHAEEPQMFMQAVESFLMR
jgi:pimeloyl-ACP methyl ester carboxylesterase